ncbi:MAG: RecQ family ATP-dependent DNA helicase, partial [Candidatus Caldatribacteriota bacterium]
LVTLSNFDIKHIKQAGFSSKSGITSELAVLHNLIIRGLPTRTSIRLEKLICETLDLGVLKTDDIGALFIEPNNWLTENITLLFRALHLADPKHPDEVESSSYKAKKTTIREAIKNNDGNEFKEDRLIYSTYAMTQDNIQNPLYDSEDGFIALQAILTPFAIARLQLALVKAFMNNILNIDAETLKICVYERDVPCAALAIEDFLEQLSRLYKLQNKEFGLKTELTVYATEKFLSAQLGEINNNKFIHTNRVEDINALQSDEKEYDLYVDFSMLRTSLTDNVPLKVRTKNTIRILSNLIHKDERKIITTSSIQYAALQGDTPNSQRNLGLLRCFLQDLFRKDKFRDGQIEVLNKALQNESVVGLMPTGHGKSITYQLSALLQPGICLIVDPVNSLMYDQSHSLDMNGISLHRLINSHLSRRERETVLKSFEAREALFVFVSPERLQTEEFQTTLKKKSTSKTFFSYCVIDEVHCVSEWGHDFRVSYLNLGKTVEKYCKSRNLEAIPLIGLSATASYDVLTDVCREITRGTKNYEEALKEEIIIRHEVVNRNELEYVVKEVAPPGSSRRVSRDEAFKSKMEWITSLLKENHSNFDDENQYAGIIYCPHRSGPYGVSKDFGKDNLNKIGIWDIINNNEQLNHIRAGRYAGWQRGSKAILEEILETQKQFIKNNLNLLVTTNAFGVGIDKPNVRFTIHFNSPRSVESFIQEAGRAGRDKMKSKCYILFNRSLMLMDKNNPVVEPPANEVDFDINAYFHNMAFSNAELENAAIYDMLEGNYIITAPALRAIKREVADKFQDDVQVSYWELRDKSRMRMYIKLKNETSYYLPLLEADNNHNTNKHENANNSDKKDPETLQIIDFVRGCILRHLKLNCPDDENKVKTIFDKKNKGTPLKTAINKQSSAVTVETIPFYIKLTNKSRYLNMEQEKLYPDGIQRALYRMSLIGAIDNYTVDYHEEIFIVTITNKDDEQYFENLGKYISTYYSYKRTQEELKKARAYKNGETAMLKCLYFLTDFIYREIEVKRWQGIHTMREACLISIEKGSDELKTFINDYFNSKYLSLDYQVEGKDLSLTSRISLLKEGKDDDLSIVRDFMEYLKKDKEDSETSRLQQLRGACSRLLEGRENTAALLLLKAFTLFILSDGNIRLEEEAKDLYLKGFNLYSEETPKTMSHLNHLINGINAYQHNLTQYMADDKEILNTKIKKFTIDQIVQYQAKWLALFEESFLANYDKRLTSL